MHNSAGRTHTQPLSNPLAEALPKDTVNLPLNAAESSLQQIEPSAPLTLAFASPKVTPNDHTVPTNVCKPPRIQQPGSTQAG